MTSSWLWTVLLLAIGTAEVTREHDGSIYSFDGQSKGVSWFLGKIACEKSGSKLTSIHDKGENTFVHSLGMGGYWIGLLRSRKQPGTFQWSDSSEFNYAKWKTGEPPSNGDTGGRDCVYMDNSGQWATAKCATEKPTVCKKVVNCSMLSEPANGTMSSNQSGAAVGSVLKFSCAPGFNLVGSATRRCNSSHQWTGVQPKCQDNSTSNSSKHSMSHDYPTSVLSSLIINSSPMISYSKFLSSHLQSSLNLPSTIPVISFTAIGQNRNVSDKVLTSSRVCLGITGCHSTLPHPTPVTTQTLQLDSFATLSLSPTQSANISSVLNRSVDANGIAIEIVVVGGVTGGIICLLIVAGLITWAVSNAVKSKVSRDTQEETLPEIDFTKQFSSLVITNEEDKDGSYDTPSAVYRGDTNTVRDNQQEATMTVTTVTLSPAYLEAGVILHKESEEVDDINEYCEPMQALRHKPYLTDKDKTIVLGDKRHTAIRVQNDIESTELASWGTVTDMYVKPGTILSRTCETTLDNDQYSEPGQVFKPHAGIREKTVDQATDHFQQTQGQDSCQQIELQGKTTGVASALDEGYMQPVELLSSKSDRDSDSSGYSRAGQRFRNELLSANKGQSKLNNECTNKRQLCPQPPPALMTNNKSRSKSPSPQALETGAVDTQGYLILQTGVLDTDGYLEPATFQSSKNNKTGIGNVPVRRNSPVSSVERDYEYKEMTYWLPGTTEEVLYIQMDGMRIRQIDQDSICTVGFLGSGAFGFVRKAEWTIGGSKRVVAVKTLNKDTAQNRVKFLREAAIMSQFHHRNVITLYGTYIAGSPMMLVMDYMENGNLKSWLDVLKINDKPETASTLLRASEEIVHGMVYLAAKSFIHRDLAARNVLVDNESTMKIGDFGLTRDLIDDSYYITQSTKLPIRWTAIEAVNYQKYTTASDVWSYGIVLYEIWSLGEHPYGLSVSNTEVVDMVSNGYRLPPPKGCPKVIYQLMMDCWHPEHHSRPKFIDIQDRLHKYKNGTSIGGSRAGLQTSKPSNWPAVDYNNLQHQYKER